LVQAGKETDIQMTKDEMEKLWIWNSDKGGKMKSIKNALSKHLRTKPNKHEFEKRFNIDTKMSPTLIKTKKRLEFAQKSDIISISLRKRSSQTLDPIIKSLKYQMQRDALNEKICTKLNKQDLIKMNILKSFSTKMANSLQPMIKSLKWNMRKDAFNQLFCAKLDKDEVSDMGILNAPPISNDVDSQRLNIQKASSYLQRALVHRKSIDCVRTEAGYLNVARSLQSVAKELDSQRKKDGLKKALRARLSVKQAAMYGVNVKTAAAIQSTMHNLIMAQKRDSISRKMKKRPSAKEIGINTRLAPGLQSIARTLEMKLKCDCISRQLVISANSSMCSN